MNNLSIVISVAALLGVLALAWKMRKSLRGLFHILQSQSQLNSALTEQLVMVCKGATQAIANSQSETAKNYDCNSQHGEEFHLWQACRWKRNGFYIEIGAYDGQRLSNSLFFEQLGWDGILIEAHPDLYQACKTGREATVIHTALGDTEGGHITFTMVDGPTGLDTLSFVNAPDSHLKRIESEGGKLRKVDVPSRTLDGILAGRPGVEIDWVSIDVEGAEMSVLKGFDLKKYKPRVIMVEDNSGGQDARVTQYLHEHGYSPGLLVGCNRLYTQNS